MILEEDVNKGLCGKKYKQLLSKYPFPEGTFGNEVVLCHCKKCGNWRVGWDLNFYRKDFEIKGDRIFEFARKRKVIPADPNLMESGNRCRARQ
ncbi:MAG: hypothetical protein ACOYJO_03835 [Eubacterium sp.]